MLFFLQKVLYNETERKNTKTPHIKNAKPVQQKLSFGWFDSVLH